MKDAVPKGDKQSKKFINNNDDINNNDNNNNNYNNDDVDDDDDDDDDGMIQFQKPMVQRKWIHFPMVTTALGIESCIAAGNTK